MSGSLSFELLASPQRPGIELFDDCGGSFQSNGTLIDGNAGRADFEWTPPKRSPTVCALTAIVANHDVASQFTVVIRVDEPTVSEAFDLGALRVAEYRWGKRAAASYTFDDGCASSFQIADIFESVGFRATFFIIAGWVLDANWPRWKGLADRGHEIGNHSLTHLDLASPDLTDDQLTMQIDGAQQRIERNIGERPTTFAFPGNSASPRSAAIALRSHLATRNPGLPFGSGFGVFHLNSRTTSDALNAGLEDALAAGSWFVVAGHGIDGNGWEPLSSEVLVTHLTTAASLSSALWVDTFRNVARYRLAREQVQPIIIAASQQTLRVRLDGNPDASLLAVPLTLEVPIVQPPAAVRAHDASGAEVPIVVAPGAILVEVLPLQEIELEILPSGA